MQEDFSLKRGTETPSSVRLLEFSLSSIPSTSYSCPSSPMFIACLRR